MAKNPLTRLFLLGCILASLTPLPIFAAGLPGIGFQFFGGRILNITPIVINPLCPANVGFIMIVGLPKPAVVNVPIITPPLVKNGPAIIGAWALGLATPGVATCLPIAFLMGVSGLP